MVFPSPTCAKAHPFLVGLTRILLSSYPPERLAMPVSIQHNRSANRTLRIISPNGHLGFAPIKTGSFEIGLASEPDLICADSGSCDIGPGPLGADFSCSPLAWQTHDLEHMLLGARRLNVPMIIGSAGDTGNQ